MNYNLAQLVRDVSHLLKEMESTFEPVPGAVPVYSTATRQGRQYLLIAFELRQRQPDTVPVFLRRNP